MTACTADWLRRAQEQVSFTGLEYDYASEMRLSKIIGHVWFVEVQLEVDDTLPELIFV